MRILLRMGFRLLKSIKKSLSILLNKYGFYQDDYLSRIELLIKKGLKIGKNVTIENSVYIDIGYPYLITVGDNCSLASGVRLLAHDDTPFKFTEGYARIGKIDIKDNCFIGENCIILPGVTIGPNVVVAAGSVVNKNIPPNSCVAGNPARFYASFDDFLASHKKNIETSVKFDYYDLRVCDMSEEMKSKVIVATNKDFCYVKGKKGKIDNHNLWNPVNGRF